MKFHECKLYGTRKRSDNFVRKNQKRIKMNEGPQSRNKVDSNIKRNISFSTLRIDRWQEKKPRIFKNAKTYELSLSRECPMWVLLIFSDPCFFLILEFWPKILDNQA